MKIAFAPCELRDVYGVAEEIVDGGHTVAFCATLTDALKGNPNLVFAGWPEGGLLPGFLEGLKAAHGVEKQIPVIVLVPPGSATAEKRAKEAGAYGILSSPPSPWEIGKKLREHVFKGGIGAIRSEFLVGNAPKFCECLAILKKIAGQKALNVLLVGETGTGKGMFAEVIHELSPRSPRREMITAHLASLAGENIQSELFGHEKGAWTGAITTRIGRLEDADGTTLFLDDIGAVTESIQARLLRFLEGKGFERMGSNKTLVPDVRVIAAAHPNLPELVNKGTFREDLYFRLAGVVIQLPSLRDRPGDIELLAKRFVSGRLTPVTFTDSALNYLTSYHWPGNVRQLKNTVASACALAEKGMIDEELLKKVISNYAVTSRLSSGCIDIKIPLERGDDATVEKPKTQYIKAQERAALEVDKVMLPPVLARHKRDFQEAANELGIGVDTLRERRKAVDEDTKGLYGS